MIETKMKRSICLLAILLALVGRPAFAQTIEAGLDLHVPEQSATFPGQGESLEFSDGLGVHLGVWSSSFGPTSNNKFRWGIMVRYQSLALGPNDLGFKEKTLSSKSFDFSLEREFYRSGKWFVTGDLGLGVTFVSELEKQDPLDSFALFPGHSGFNIMMRGNVGCDVSDHVGLVLSVRGMALGPSDEDHFPFEKGPVVSVGFRVN